VAGVVPSRDIEMLVGGGIGHLVEAIGCPQTREQKSRREALKASERLGRRVRILGLNLYTRRATNKNALAPSLRTLDQT
jgi:hypothetical protein